MTEERMIEIAKTGETLIERLAIYASLNMAKRRWSDADTVEYGKAIAEIVVK